MVYGSNRVVHVVLKVYGLLWDDALKPRRDHRQDIQDDNDPWKVLRAPSRRWFPKQKGSKKQIFVVFGSHNQNLNDFVAVPFWVYYGFWARTYLFWSPRRNYLQRFRQVPNTSGFGLRKPDLEWVLKPENPEGPFRLPIWN